MFRNRQPQASGEGSSAKKPPLTSSVAGEAASSSGAPNMFSHRPPGDTAGRYGGPDEDSSDLYPSRRGARRRDDQHSGGGGTEDADVALVREQYAYNIKLHVNKLRDLSEKQQLGQQQQQRQHGSSRTWSSGFKCSSSFDHFILMWLFYYEDRGARAVQMLLDTNIRIPVVPLEELLCAVPDSEFDSFLTQLADIEECLLGSQRLGGGGVDSSSSSTGAGATSPSAIWRLAREYLSSLKAVRLLANHKAQFRMEESIEDQVLELLRTAHGRLDPLIAQLQVMLLAIDGIGLPGSEEDDGNDDAVPQPNNTTSCAGAGGDDSSPSVFGHLDAAFLEAALKMATLERCSSNLQQFHDSHFIEGGLDSLPPPPAEEEAAMLTTMQAPDHCLTVAEATVIMEKSGETLEENEEMFTEEVANINNINSGGRRGSSNRGVNDDPALQPGMNIHQETQSKAKNNSSVGKKKPQRFAKVQTGFHWTKYNKAHYDYKNPPPKVVMSYEFTLKYPDCVNNRKPPSYKVEPTDKGWDDDHCNLVFVANSPVYEDVTYRIINKKWQGAGGGVKCTFNHFGELKLYFRFESSSYRR